jgi:hypothetical protein
MHLVLRAKTVDWDHPFNVAVVKVDDVLSGAQPILLVTHDDGHGGWQVLDGADVSGRKAMVVPKEVILDLDPTISHITDLPVGWRATRSSPGEQWNREMNPDAH